MTRAAHTVLKEALLLNPIERAELIDELYHSFEKNREGRTEALWAAESESRIDAFDAGKLSADSAEAVFDRINTR